MRRNHVTALLIAILLLGFGVRIASFQWNWFMHADVIDDSTVATSVLRDGRFLSYENPQTADPSLYPPLPTEGGKPLVLHGPIISVLGAATTWVRGGEATVADAFTSLRILSLLAGMAVIWLVFLIGARLFSESAGLAAAAWTAASYVLIDYAGNGALYTLQSAIYLAWILTAIGSPSLRRTALLGIIAGVGYLTHLQCIILLPAGLCVLAMQERSWGRFFRHASLFLVVALPLIGLWLARNVAVFGDPFYTHSYNTQYVYGKAGLADHIGNITIWDNLGVLHGIVTLWLPNNLYYAARKLFILAPFAFFLFSYGLLDVAFSSKRLRHAFPLFIVFFLQILLSASWPVWKFRFFVPILPLVFLIAVEHLHHLSIRPAYKRACVGVTLVCMVIVGVLTYRAVPTHTTYFDGALTQDPFHGSEELTYLRAYKIFPSDDAR